jgi:hypothetical protein
MTTRWWSQPFAPEGSAAAEGIVKQLGRPLLDPLTVLVREAAQNSWDARAGGAQVDFRISLRTLGALTDSWRELILPGPTATAELLDASVTHDAVLLVVSDRGTRGLGGPLRAGARPAHGEKADFVQFLRNVGEPNDNEFGGGTYGFGKGIFYRLSRTSAILVDTMTIQGDRRLMGAALGNSWYDDDDQRYTGRHWWGDIAADGIPDPYIGLEAADLAARLGLPGFADDATGTDVALIAADLGTSEDAGESRPRTVQEAGLFLASSMLWHLWPKAVKLESAPSMRFSVEIDGELLQVPDPHSVSELRPFVQSLEKVRTGTAHGYRRTVAPKDAGRLALTVGAATTQPIDEIVEMAKPYEGPSHHVARMRVAELVVDYLPTSTHPDGLLRYGGVFRSTLDSDEYFASSEPPTHDSWVEKGLSGTARGVVQGARNFVVKTVDAELGLGDGATGGQAKGLGALSSRLASLLPSVSATGPGAKHSRPSGGSGGQGRVVPRIVDGPNLHRYNGKLHLMAKVHVPASATDRTVRAEVAVVVEGGGRESAPPAGAPVPVVTGWRTEGDRGIDGPEVVVRPGDSTDWWVFASYVPDAVVRFRITEGATDGK